jgi:hypothetical protein
LVLEPVVFRFADEPFFFEDDFFAPPMPSALPTDLTAFLADDLSPVFLVAITRPLYVLRERARCLLNG